MVTLVSAWYVKKIPEQTLQKIIADIRGACQVVGLNSVEFSEQVRAINIMMIAFETMPVVIPHKDEIRRLNELWGEEQIYLSKLDEIKRRRNKNTST